MRCLFCLGHSLRTSRYRWYEWPLAMLLLRPLRCADCGRRSVGFLWSADSNRGPLWFPEAWGAHTTTEPVADVHPPIPIVPSVAPESVAPQSPTVPEDVTSHPPSAPTDLSNSDPPLDPDEPLEPVLARKLAG
jgi:hypothetical protein